MKLEHIVSGGLGRCPEPFVMTSQIMAHACVLWHRHVTWMFTITDLVEYWVSVVEDPLILLHCAQLSQEWNQIVTKDDNERWSKKFKIPHNRVLSSQFHWRQHHETKNNKIKFLACEKCHWMGAGTWKRLQRELKDLQREPMPFDLGLFSEDSECTHWVSRILGPEGSFYEGGIFWLNIFIPEGIYSQKIIFFCQILILSKDYPFCVPKVRLITKIYHPNVSRNGVIDLGILHDRWSPAHLIKSIMFDFLALLELPNPDDPTDPEIAYQFKTNFVEFKKTCKEWLAMYATEAQRPPELEGYSWFP